MCAIGEEEAGRLSIFYSSNSPHILYFEVLFNFYVVLFIVGCCAKLRFLFSVNRAVHASRQPVLHF